MNVLNIISSGYRATFEEQDDTIVWLSHALANAGAELGVLLRGAAVNYVLPAPPPAPLAIGDRQQKSAPDVHGQVAALGEKVPLFVVAEDLARRGVETAPRGKYRLVSESDLPALMMEYSQVWRW
ncbi:MAG: hypothetical protein ACXWUN_11480 [Allosphingosinicella sp.]